MMDRAILETVAWADIIICYALRLWPIVAVAFMLILLVVIQEGGERHE